MNKMVLWVALLVSTLFLLYLGFKNEMQPPIWTAVGFIAISGLLFQNNKPPRKE